MNLLLRGQLRAGRALVGITQQDLSGLSGISLSTIKRLETELSPRQGLAANLHTIQVLEEALLGAGVVCVNDEQLGPGVRLKQ